MNESAVNNPILKENELTRAILAGVDTGEYDAEISMDELEELAETCLLYTSPSPRDRSVSRMPSSA